MYNNINQMQEVFISCTILEKKDNAISVMFHAACIEVGVRIYTKKIYAWFPKSSTEVLDEHLIKTEGRIFSSILIEEGVRPEDFDRSAWISEDGHKHNYILANGEVI